MQASDTAWKRLHRWPMTPFEVQSYPYLHSDFGGDPELAELVEMFVAEMPDRIRRVVQHASAHDWENLTRTAHQLKGAAGSYGFHQLTQPAKRLEQCAVKREPEELIQEAVNELVALCQRLRSGPAPKSA